MHRDPTFWLLARAAGLTAYALLDAVRARGACPQVASVRPPAPGGRDRRSTRPRAVGLGAARLHAVALVLDSTVQVSLAALVVPGLVPYRPAAVAAGVIAGRLFVLVTRSFWLRKRIGTRLWRRVHWATYALFALATVHGVAAEATPPGRGVRPLSQRPGRRHRRNRLACSCSTHPTSTPKGATS